MKPVQVLDTTDKTEALKKTQQCLSAMTMNDYVMHDVILEYIAEEQAKIFHYIKQYGDSPELEKQSLELHKIREEFSHVDYSEVKDHDAMVDAYKARIKALSIGGWDVLDNASAIV